jgi:hypothetical protein
MKAAYSFSIMAAAAAALSSARTHSYFASSRALDPQLLASLQTVERVTTVNVDMRLYDEPFFLSFFIPHIQVLGAARQIECTLYGLTEIVLSYIIPSPSSRVDGHLNRSCLVGLGPGCASGGG